MTEPRTCSAWAVTKNKAPLEKISITLPSLKPDEVEIKVEFCGICHSDVHYADGEWGGCNYPAVVGHEIIGKITALGSSVTHLQVGQNVGVGWQRSSCGVCMNCLLGSPNLCPMQTTTCTEGNHGGFAEYHRTNSKFVVPIPDGLPLETAGPLLCAGCTSFSPLFNKEIRAWHSVGIVGVGGLGHLAIQWANKFGCDVHSFTTSESKVEECKKLGAHQAHVYGPETEEWSFPELMNYFDLIIVAVPFDVKINWLIQMLKPTGNICYLANPPNPVSFSPVSLFAGSQKGLCGANQGPPHLAHIVLSFAQRHKIAPVCEIIPVEKINEGWEKVRKGTARYRVVVKF